jgi:hypothetical protein
MAKHLLALLLLLASCKTPEPAFLQTGPVYPPLPAETPIKAYLIEQPPAFEEIGIVEVYGGNLPSRIERAQKIARERGANAIVALSERTHVSGGAGDTAVSSTAISAFALIRLKETTPTSAPTTTPAQ